MRTAASLATAALTAALLVGCGSEPDGPVDPAAAGTPTVDVTTSDSDLAQEKTEEDSSASAEELDNAFGGPVLTVQADGDRVRPNSVQVEIGVDEELRIRMESNRPVELHVHSSPEQTLEFEAGRSTKTITFERAGVVEIEEHGGSDQVIAIVTVR